MKRPVPEALRAARRSLDAIPAVRLLQDWTWVDDVAVWVLHCEISIQSSDNNLVPDRTEWFVLVSSDYPYGYLEFFPSKKNSLSRTFPHQMFNGEGKSNFSWREGNICLSSSSEIFKGRFIDAEPFEIDWRLHWRFERAIQWLNAASENQLRLAGEPFELPDFPKRFQKTLSSVVFNENAASFSQWQQIADLMGLVDLHPLQQRTNALVAKAFRSTKGQELFRPDWGKILTEMNSSKVLGLWIRLTQAPILEPWQAPSNWKELREVFRNQQCDLDELLRSTLRLIRTETIQVLLIGFPIPSEIGSSPSRIHWQCQKMPALSSGQETAKGFRHNELGYWRRDRTELLRDSHELCWTNSENWSSDQIMTRGHFSQRLTSKKILLIGAGSLGSVIGEMLVRGGLTELLIIDSDVLEVGNLCRHTLTTNELQKSKSVELSRRLNCISPHVKAEAFVCDFPPLSEAQSMSIQQCDLILDCTGSDLVIQKIENFQWESEKFFVSMSLGMEAKRLFLFATKGTKFSSESFRSSLNPWLVKEREEYGDKPMPWSGIGCWHPVFPAKVNDVWMLAAVAVKCLNTLVESTLIQENMMVFEQETSTDNDWFQGIRRVDEYK